MASILQRALIRTQILLWSFAKSVPAECVHGAECWNNVLVRGPAGQMALSVHFFQLTFFGNHDLLTSTWPESSWILRKSLNGMCCDEVRALRMDLGKL